MDEYLHLSHKLVHYYELIGDLIPDNIKATLLEQLTTKEKGLMKKLLETEVIIHKKYKKRTTPIQIQVKHKMKPVISGVTISS